MVNGINMLRKDNPRWAVINASETRKVPGVGRLGVVTAVGEAIRSVAALVAAWLTGLPRRAGRRLFAMNDREARWRGWQIIETVGGLGRQYRDWRFLEVSAPSLPRPAVPEAWDDHWDGRALGSGKGDPSACPQDGDG